MGNGKPGAKISASIFEDLVMSIEPPSLKEGGFREGLVRTPARAAKAFDFLTSGYTTDLGKLVNDAIFEEECDELVVVPEIEFYSLCEHHLLPFYGHVNVGYIPSGRIIGLSKIPRIVDMFSRRLQVQERMTNQVMDCLVELLDPIGCGVITIGYHMCMSMRGVMKQNAHMKTSALHGAFKEQTSARMEFLEMIKI